MEKKIFRGIVKKLKDEIAEKDKQIEELKQDAIDLLKDIDDINKQHEEEVNALEAQIEKMKEELFTTNGRLSLAKALLTQWQQSGCDNINIVSDTQRFLEVNE